MKQELRSIAPFLVRNRDEVAIVGFASLFLTLANYHPLWNDWFSALFYYGLLPIGVLLLLRRNPLDFGLRFGRIKEWWLYFVITCLVITPFLIVASHLDAFQRYYRQENFNLARYAFETIVYLFGWEYIYRGFLLFGLQRKMGEASILVQTIPFVLLHFGKPELETLSTIITGVGFGFIAYRAKSFWPAYLIHLFINISFLSIVNLR